MTKHEREVIIRTVNSQPKKSYDMIAADLGISKPTLLPASKAQRSAHG